MVLPRVIAENSKDYQRHLVQKMVNDGKPRQSMNIASIVDAIFIVNRSSILVLNENYPRPTREGTSEKSDGCFCEKGCFWWELSGKYSTPNMVFQKSQCLSDFQEFGRASTPNITGNGSLNASLNMTPNAGFESTDRSNVQFYKVVPLRAAWWPLTLGDALGVVLRVRLGVY